MVERIAWPWLTALLAERRRRTRRSRCGAAGPGGMPCVRRRHRRGDHRTEANLRWPGVRHG